MAGSKCGQIGNNSDTIDDVGKQVIQGGFKTRGCIIIVSDVKSAVKRLEAHENNADLLFVN